MPNEQVSEAVSDDIVEFVDASDSDSFAKALRPGGAARYLAALRAVFA